MEPKNNEFCLRLSKKITEMEGTPSQQPRRSLRTRKSTAKALDFEALNSYRSPRKSRNRIISESESEESENCDESQDAHYHVTDTVSTTAALAGSEIYGFTKVKKHEHLITTPQKQNKVKPIVPKTPHHLRKRLGKGIKSAVQESSDDEPFQASESDFSCDELPSSSDSSEDEQEEDESDSDAPLVPPTRSTKKAVNTKIKHGKTSKVNNYVIKADEYFSQCSDKVTTSNHTLDKLKTPRLSQDQLHQLLSQMKLSKQHQKAVYRFAQNSHELFAKWLCLLHENFNILLYGLGSKKTILNNFHLQTLSDSPVIVVNGFFPSLTLKDILDAIANDLLGLKESTANVNEAVDMIEHEIQASSTHFYLIVHNIEGDMLRNNKSQAILSRLSAMPKFHLITSIDHINAPLIWDHSKLSKFNFVWFDVTSFLPYTDETSFESSMMVQRTGNLALSSLRNVFLSLTSNSKGIYTIIMKYQLENNNSQYYQGMLFKDLYTACREAFLVSSDLALRAQLTEFVDHKMVRIKRAADGAEYLVISIANNLLQQFLNEQNK